jgi:ABC superfamily ATP binding cassette transporter permease protein
MKKIFSYGIALVPILLLISLLFLLPIFFLISLIPSNYFPIPPIWIIEFFIVFLILVYGIRLNKFPINLKAKIVYWIVFILLIITIGTLFLCFKNLLIIFVFCQLFLPIIYILLFESKFNGVKKYIQKSRNTFCFFNLFDSSFIGVYFLLKFIITKWGNNINSFLKELDIPQNVIEPIVLVLFFIILFILIPFFRGYLAVWIYKKQNNIFIPSENAIWNVNIGTYLISLGTIFLYTSTLFQSDKYEPSAILITCFTLMSFNIFLWVYIFEDIDRGGENKETVKSNWLLWGLLLTFLVLLDQIESDLIGILTWFLPMLLPYFIGEVNSIIPGGDSKSPTPAMKKHLYWLQIMSFNTLFVFNIISAISTKQLINNSQIEQVNTFKVFLISLIGKKSSSNFMLGILVSLIMLLISLAIAYGLSKLMIYLIRRFYIETSNRYFN